MTLLVLTLLAFLDPDVWFAKDLAFSQVQTEWLLAVHQPRRLDDLLGSDRARAIRALGCDHYDCRTTASAHLRADRGRAVPALIVGTKHADPEIRERCQVLLEAMGQCAACLGRGVCRGTVVLSMSGSVVFPECVRCAQSAHFGSRVPERHACYRCLQVGWTNALVEAPELVEP
ncbi:MAG: hypothetical protein AB7G11_02575 [Phycisphaerales bacterium]